jgi:uncharacterized protein
LATAQPFVVMAKPVGPVCNLECGYCYYLKKSELFPAGEPFKMRPEVLEAYVSGFIAASPGPVVHFGWHGGEPTLAGIGFYRRVVELQRRYLPAGWRCVNNLQTNGTLLDEDWCDFLAEHNFAVGISIDGPAEIHDRYRCDRRGRPSHKRAMRGLELLNRAGVDPDVLCTLNAASADDPARVYRFFVDHGVRWVQFLPVVERLAGGGVSERSISPTGFGEFLCSAFDEWVRHDIERLGVQNFLECFLVASGRPPNICVMSATCGGILALEHDGGVYACDHFVDPEHKRGELARDSLSALVDSPEQIAFGRVKTDTLPRYCRDCPELRFCNGGCPKDRIATSPEGEAGLNYLCPGYRRFYSHVRPYLEHMAALALTGRPISAISRELAVAEGAERSRWNLAGRNEPCPCGSGRKFKQCCLRGRRR